MSRTVISVEQLGKHYMLGGSSARGYQKLSDSLWQMVSAPFRSASASSSGSKTEEPFWALQDVSFEVQEGEVLGIIGRNGAGKSTLLKILSRITEPSTGSVTLRGRVGSLLEVGTGFHPELTGRENIYLNGAILGMKRAEIRQAFDEIVDFAGVERFLNTPVKRYSSGMHVRLAFSVAAHLRPEILIVDEVLAVGDAEFQARCLGKMQDVARNSGRTVLFVSHNLAAVRQLTTRCLLLRQGRLEHVGTPDSAVERYLNIGSQGSEAVAHLPRVGDCQGGARFTQLSFSSEPAVFEPGEPLRFEAVLQCDQPLSAARISLSLLSADGSAVASGFSAAQFHASGPGSQRASVRFTPPLLAPGRYRCTIALAAGEGGVLMNLDAVTDVLPFEILPSQTDGRTPLQWQSAWGAVQLPELELVLQS